MLAVSLHLVLDCRTNKYSCALAISSSCRNFICLVQFIYLFTVITMSGERRITVDEGKLHVTSIFQKTGDHAVLDHTADSDEEVLVALGYKQEFKRDFSIWESFSVSFSVLGLLPSIASTLGYNLAYSGPAGSVWGWVIAGILIQFVAFAMAELCSSMPTAGGLYYASAVLAPEGWGPLCSWVCSVMLPHVRC